MPAIGLYTVHVLLNAQEGFQHEGVEGPLPRWKVHVGLRQREVVPQPSPPPLPPLLLLVLLRVLHAPVSLGYCLSTMLQRRRYK